MHEYDMFSDWLHTF